MEQENNEFSTSEREIERSEIPDDIDKLATRPSQQVKPYQENLIKEKLSKARIAESQESTRGKLAIAIIGIYGTTIPIIKHRSCDSAEHGHLLGDILTLFLVVIALVFFKQSEVLLKYW